MIRQLLAAIIGLAVVFVIFRILQRSLSRRFEDPDTRYSVRKFISLAGYIVAILVVANVYSDRLSGLTIALGVAGAGVAFALQELIASVAGWLAITIGGLYSTGHRIQLGGIKGDVIDIGVFRTTLMEVGDWVNGDLYNGRIVRVANSFAVKQPVFNYSADFPFLWDEITLPIHYGSDWKRARTIIETCTEEVIGDYPAQSLAAWKAMVGKYRLENASVEPVVTMSANQDWFTFTARYIVDYRKRRTTKDQLFTRIFEEIELTDGAVQVGASSMEITSAPPKAYKQPRPEEK